MPEEHHHGNAAVDFIFDLFSKSEFNRVWRIFEKRSYAASIQRIFNYVLQVIEIIAEGCLFSFILPATEMQYIFHPRFGSRIVLFGLVLSYFIKIFRDVI